ncbi:hypothetical protein TRIUR3_04825 [Triticum urartu]|uniref:Uncharacterized protein n=1 Tax=Triticum urartu TaxID=4572 RepID=M7ZZ69_TRIUA|nr:hypothetical protein TRIUR3_04825 [Triticum urartu]
MARWWQSGYGGLQAHLQRGRGGKKVAVAGGRSSRRHVEGGRTVGGSRWLSRDSRIPTTGGGSMAVEVARSPSWDSCCGVIPIVGRWLRRDPHRGTVAVARCGAMDGGGDAMWGNGRWRRRDPGRGMDPAPVGSGGAFWVVQGGGMRQLGMGMMCGSWGIRSGVGAANRRRVVGRATVAGISGGRRRCAYNLVAALFVAINVTGRRKMVGGGEAGTVLLIYADVKSIINSTEVWNSRSSWRLSPMCSDLNCSNNPQQDVEEVMIHDGLSITQALCTARIFDGGFIRNSSRHGQRLNFRGSTGQRQVRTAVGSSRDLWRHLGYKAMEKGLQRAMPLAADRSCKGTVSERRMQDVWRQMEPMVMKGNPTET